MKCLICKKKKDFNYVLFLGLIIVNNVEFMWEIMNYFINKRISIFIKCGIKLIISIFWFFIGCLIFLYVDFRM